MESVLKSDIFFLITSLVVVVLGILAVVAFYYLINILRDVKDVSRSVKKETQEIVQDISIMRTNAKNGRVIAGLFGFLKAMFRRKGRK